MRTAKERTLYTFSVEVDLASTRIVSRELLSHLLEGATYGGLVDLFSGTFAGFGVTSRDVRVRVE